ncbi:MAG TPA: hypothetical protein VMR97_02640 [Acidimicrobiales bacterium]|nr:hypothetical protein [Acidimicrobiales bacterium]
MAVSEESRHRLYSKLELVLGSEEATVLMEHLPPVGWADVATKRDLDALEARIGGRFEAVDARFEAVDVRFEAVDVRFDALESRMDARFDAMDSRFEALEGRLTAKFEYELRMLTWRLLVVLVAAMSVLVTVTRLIG